MQKALNALEAEVEEINANGTVAANNTVPTNDTGEDGAGDGATVAAVRNHLQPNIVGWQPGRHRKLQQQTMLAALR